jgi:uncharacterized protein (TIGR02118 family)
MIKVSVLYPHRDGGKFNMDYYCKSHMPMVKDRLGAALKGMAVEQGLGGGAPGAPPAYAAMGHLYFESANDFQAGFERHAKEFMDDVPNYTDLEPIIQISEVKL